MVNFCLQSNTFCLLIDPIFTCVDPDPSSVSNWLNTVPIWIQIHITLFYKTPFIVLANPIRFMYSI